MVKKRRHLAKALTWRASASIITALVAFIIIGEISIAATIFLLDSAVKIGWYYAHERLWYKSSWGIEK